ncbi:MAG: hypothetical protein JJ975_08385 [Bacteroidia bacterium]|nr:hypothetical protein [Bacteroidia bacterium]
MERLQFVILTIHILSGYLAFISGGIVLSTRKGNSIHKKLGRLFYCSMLGVCFTSAYLAIVKDITMLLMISVFVLYQTQAGYRSVKDKSLRPNVLDLLFLLTAFVNGVFMLISGNVVALVFGGITLFLVGQDCRTYWLLSKGRVLPKQSWLRRHIGMMVGSFIGAITAFLVVNVNSFEPFWLIWLAPTMVFVPLMQYWTLKFTRNSKSI